MKKVLLLLVLAISTTFTSCGSDDLNDGPVDSCSPELITLEATLVGEITATLNGEILNETCENLDIIAQGFVFSNDILPNITDIVVGADIYGTNISRTLEYIRMNRRYYYRTFLTNINGTYYGEQKEFTTLLGEISIETLEVDPIGDDSACFTANVYFDGGLNPSRFGFVVSIQSSPTINDIVVSSNSRNGYYGSSEIHRCTHGTLFPNTEYYVRAFIEKEDEGIVYYGSEVSFTTMNW